MRPFLTLHHPSAARRYYEAGLWRDETFYGLLARRCEERPTAAALRDGRRTLTWAEVKAWVDGAAADLRGYGLAGGDRVSIWASNRVESVVLFLACSREGFACNPSLHRSHSAVDVGILLKRLGTRALFVEPGWSRTPGDQLESVLSGVPTLKVVYAPASFPTPGPFRTPPCADPDKVAYLAFTSGTTGTPKCVMHSDNTLLANARDLIRDWAHGRDTVLMTLSPLSHHIAWVAVAQWLLTGCMLVLDDPPAGVGRVDWITSTGATYVMGVPTHAMDVLSEQRARGLSRLGQVRTFYMAGAPIPPALADAFLAQGITPQNVYGMTENSSHQYTHPTDEARIITSTCGRGGGAYEVAIFDSSDPDRRLPVGEIGQIGGRGPALMLGYFGNQDATEASFNAEGWFMSGDLGRLDEAGNLTIEGRLKDLIIRGGHNIYPAHIEALALRHPNVERAACFPVADGRLGERACLAVIGDAGPDVLTAHLAAEGLSRLDMPEYFLRMPSFPLTASGKVLKRDLVDAVERGVLVPEVLPAPATGTAQT